MRISLILASLVFTTQVVYASPFVLTAENANEVEIVEDTRKVRVKEVKDLVNNLNKSETCLEDFLKRRKQLITKFILTPVTLTASAAITAFAGGAAGAGVAPLIVGPHDQWASLGYFIGGAMLGGATGVIIMTADTISAGKNFSENEMMMKALAEYYLERDHDKMELLYLKVVEKMNTPRPGYEEFIEKYLELDRTGALCDGSLVKQPRIRLGSKLKYKMARVKDLRKVFQ